VKKSIAAPSSFGELDRLLEIADLEHREHREVPRGDQADDAERLPAG
jgi:hypothetical protein